MEIRCLIVGQLQTNCYLVINEKSKNTLIIDPGDDADYIMRIISDLQVKPKAIIATHGHFDHLLAVAELKLSYQIPFLMNKKDEFLLTKMQNSAMFFTDNKAGPPPKIDDNLVGRNKLVIASQRLVRLWRRNWKLEIIDTPGHTPGSISLYSPKDKVLFCGDLLFAGGGLGRTDFAYSDKDDFTRSLKIIYRLPKETKLLSGHGDETTVGDIKLYNK